MQENGKVSAREAYEALTLFYFKTTIHGKVAVKVIAGLPQEYLDENTMSEDQSDRYTGSFTVWGADNFWT